MEREDFIHLQLSFPVNAHTDAPAYRVHDGTDNHQSTEERRKLSDQPAVHAADRLYELAERRMLFDDGQQDDRHLHHGNEEIPSALRAKP